jgi:hypothetical protein
MVCHRGAAAGRVSGRFRRALRRRAPAGPARGAALEDPVRFGAGGRRVPAAHRLAAARRGHGARGDDGRGREPRFAAALDVRNAGLDVSVAQPTAAPVAAPRVPVDEVNLVPSKMLTDFWKRGRPRRTRRRRRRWDAEAGAEPRDGPAKPARIGREAHGRGGPGAQQDADGFLEGRAGGTGQARDATRDGPRRCQAPAAEPRPSRPTGRPSRLEGLAEGAPAARAKPGSSRAPARVGAKRRRWSRDPSRPTSRPSRLGGPAAAGDVPAERAKPGSPRAPACLEKSQRGTSALAAGPRCGMLPRLDLAASECVASPIESQAPRAASGAKLRARDVWAPATGTIPAPQKEPPRGPVRL